jgi:hypothetical protein
MAQRLAHGCAPAKRNDEKTVLLWRSGFRRSVFNRSCFIVGLAVIGIAYNERRLFCVGGRGAYQYYRAIMKSVFAL